MLYDFLTSNYPISIVLAVFVGYWAYRNRSSIRATLNEERQPWPIIGSLAVTFTAVGGLWITVFDNWRQLLGYLLIEDRRYMADPMEAAATPDAIRAVTIGLLVLSVVSIAALYARRPGGYSFLVASLTLAPLYAFIMNEVRIRADAFLRQAELINANLDFVGATSTLFWSTGVFVVIASVIATAYLFLLALAAIPMRIVFRIVGARRQERAADIFGSYREHARQVRQSQSKKPDSVPLNNDATAN